MVTQNLAKQMLRQKHGNHRVCSSVGWYIFHTVFGLIKRHTSSSVICTRWTKNQIQYYCLDSRGNFDKSIKSLKSYDRHSHLSLISQLSIPILIRNYTLASLWI
ncbi:hypothetical protein AQUCO_02200065v1 [Aquilegia coerulea]|uniref:Uncharacterized protein n=1 Tax=Aquilegia coerulea TaxID=218851 RepID=A0A2G5DCY4_AQUCA|nr:hypothetical protein AQUCO_02200065v1 [Aquilegia coerulea]